MCNERLQSLEARLEILTTTVRELLAASDAATRDRVAIGLARTLGGQGEQTVGRTSDVRLDDDVADAVRAGALWDLLGSEWPQAAVRHA